MYGFLLLLGKEREQGAPVELPERSGQQQIKKLANVLEERQGDGWYFFAILCGSGFF